MLFCANAARLAARLEETVDCSTEKKMNAVMNPISPARRNATSLPVRGARGWKGGTGALVHGQAARDGPRPTDGEYEPLAEHDVLRPGA